MKLNKREEDILSGAYGPELKKCMEILVAVGGCYDAKRMIPVTSVHIAGNYPVMVHELEANPLDLIASGDIVMVNGDEGFVEIEKAVGVEETQKGVIF